VRAGLSVVERLRSKGKEGAALGTLSGAMIDLFSCICM
jgi:hypothetical protein